MDLAKSSSFGPWNNLQSWFRGWQKRTALYLVDLLAKKSGWDIDVNDEVIADMFVRVADGQVGYEELAFWFRGKIRRSDG